MVNDWLNMHNNVEEVSGYPSWKSLCEALKNRGFNGVASEIKEKGTF